MNNTNTFHHPFSHRSSSPAVADLSGPGAARTSCSRSLVGRVAGAMAIALLCVAPVVRATPLDANALPADTTWIVHLDVDAIASGGMWEMVEPILKKNVKYAQGVNRLEKIGRLKFPADLHGVTLIGPNVGEQEAVLIIDAKTDPKHLLSLLAFNETYKSEQVDGHEIHNWEDKGKKMFAAFGQDGRIIIGRDGGRVAGELKTIDGQGKRLDVKSLLPAGVVAEGGVKAAADAASDVEKERDESGANQPRAKPAAGGAAMVFYADGKQVATAAANSPVRDTPFNQLKKVWITVGEANKGVVIKSNMLANDEVVAQNILKMIEEGKSMLSFAADDDPNAMVANDAVVPLQVSADGANVSIDWNIPLDILGDLIDQAQNR